MGYRYLYKNSEGKYCFTDDIEHATIVMLDKDELADIFEEDRIKSEELSRCKTELKELRRQNKTLLKINRGKANKERGIKNRNTNHGYVLKSSTEYQSNRSPSPKFFLYWKTVLETPYEIQHDVRDVRRLFSEDFEKFKDDFGFYDLIYLLSDEWDDTHNHVIETYFKINARSGYWEVEARHTLPINVPEIPYEETPQGIDDDEIIHIEDLEIADIYPE